MCVFWNFKVCILKKFEKFFDFTIVKIVKKFVEEKFGKNLAHQTIPSFQLICVYILSMFFLFCRTHSIKGVKIPYQRVHTYIMKNL